MNLKRLPLVFFLIMLIGCGKEKEKLLETVEEVPDDIVPSKLCETLYSNIIAMFPEYKNNQQKYASLFSESAEKHIVLTKESEVFVSFVSEGATIQNTLGWYAYEAGKTPADAKAIKKEFVFPNVSNSVLKPGDMRQLGTGKFKEGTVIGFFLIVGGYGGGQVDYRKPTLYTNYEWNSGQNRQHVLFIEKQCGDIIIGFEDKPIIDGSDADYNDVIFTISDNNRQLQTVSFNLNAVGKL